MRVRLVLLAPAVFAGVSCSGPEYEAPVESKPGRYDIMLSMSAEGLPSRTQWASFCVPADQTQSMITDAAVLRSAIPFEAGCETKVAERRGNAFTIVHECTVHPDTKIEMTFNGVIGVDRFRMEGTVEATGGTARSGKVVASAMRTGDC